MAGQVTVSLAILGAMVWAVALISTAILRRKANRWTLGALLSLPIAVFCVFGFCLSFEPGVGLGWKIGYAVLFALFVAAAAIQSTRAIARKP